MPVPKESSEYDELIPEDEEIGISTLSTVLKEEEPERAPKKPKPKGKTLKDKDLKDIIENLDSIVSIGESLKFNCTQINISKIQKLAKEIKEKIEWNYE